MIYVIKHVNMTCGTTTLTILSGRLPRPLRTIQCEFLVEAGLDRTDWLRDPDDCYQNWRCCAKKQIQALCQRYEIPNDSQASHIAMRFYLSQCFVEYLKDKYNLRPQKHDECFPDACL